MQNNRSGRLIPVVHFFILVLLCFAVLAYFLLGLRPTTLIYPASLLLLGLFIWSIWSWQKLTKTWFDPYIFFLVAAMLFNGGHAFLEVFHLNRNGILDGLFFSETVLQALFLVLLGLSSFHMGGLISAARKQPGSFKEKRTFPISASSLRLVSWGLLFISFIPATIALIEATKIVLASGYSALYQQEAVTGIGATSNVLAAFLVPSALFLLVGSRDSRSGIAVSSLIILSYSIIEFFLGDRSNAVMPLIAYAWLWHWTVRPLPKTILITSGMIVMFVVFPVVKETRDIAGYARSLAILINTFYSIDNPFVTVVHEMGGSMQTVAYTLDLVPGFRPFDIGQGYLYALLTIFPNLFWDVHPTIARGLAATWLTKTVAPYIASIGGGLGYSFIAEAYLNFGWLGAPVALGLIGFFYGKFVLWAQQSREPAKMATVAAFTAFFLFYARGESGSIVRLLVWYALLPYGLCHYVSRLTLKGKKRS